MLILFKLLHIHEGKNELRANILDMDLDYG